jgi:hypothetical protein
LALAATDMTDSQKAFRHCHYAVLRSMQFAHNAAHLHMLLCDAWCRPTPPSTSTLQGNSDGQAAVAIEALHWWQLLFDSSEVADGSIAALIWHSNGFCSMQGESCSAEQFRKCPWRSAASHTVYHDLAHVTRCTSCVQLCVVSCRSGCMQSLCTHCMVVPVKAVLAWLSWMYHLALVVVSRHALSVPGYAMYMHVQESRLDLNNLFNHFWRQYAFVCASRNGCHATRPRANDLRETANFKLSFYTWITVAPMRHIHCAAHTLLQRRSPYTYICVWWQ